MSNDNTTTTLAGATDAKKRNPSITTEVREGKLVIAFPKLAAPGVESTITVYPAELHPLILEQAVLHGLKQKLVDAAAISRNPANGASATDLDKYEAVMEVFQRISGENPSWNATERGGSDASILFQALCRMQPKVKPEAVRAWLDSRAEADRKALMRNPEVVATVATIRAERAKAAGANPDALMAELAGLDEAAEPDGSGSITTHENSSDWGGE